MLWDRVLAEALRRSGKPRLVVKTPSNVLVWERIAACWPDAQFVFLLRHPAGAVASLHSSFDPAWRPEEAGSMEESVARGLRYMNVVEEARSALPGFTVRYEELTAEPERVVRELCGFLGLPFEPGMLEYGEFGHAGFTPGLGDSSLNIRSGRIRRRRRCLTRYRWAGRHLRRVGVSASGQQAEQRGLAGGYGVDQLADRGDLDAHLVPGCSHFGGFMPMATPDGVPVAMMSPGSSVIPLEM